MVTIKDISKIVGVSPATVSKALNGYSDVSPKTAEKIREVARELHYLPNVAAQSLKTNTYYMIGILFEDETNSGLTHEYFAGILNAAKEELEKYGYDITFIHRKVTNRTVGFLQHAKYRRCDGVLIANVNFEDPEVKELVDSELATVTIDFSYEGHSSVLSDNVNGGYTLMKTLLDQGHRKIGVIKGEDTLVTKKRVNGLCRALREQNVELSSEYILEGRYHNIELTRKLTAQLLDLEEPPTAIMFPDDYAYLGGLQEIEKRGLRVPEDISVVGYDGVPMSQVIRPRLATYRQDVTQIGIRSARKLVESIEQADTCVPEQLMVAGKMLIGNSIKAID